MNKTQQTTIQAKLFDFALMELVRNHRNSFEPLWTIDSWVKFLIWLTLNCGLSGEQQTLELFADSLGAPLTRRMRRVFFERQIEEFSVSVIADPAEESVFVMPTSNEVILTPEKVGQALEVLGLGKTVLIDQSSWGIHEGMFSIPWISQKRDN